MTQTNDLIKELCDGCEPVKPICSWRCGLGWTVFVVIFNYYVVSWLGVRSDLGQYLSSTYGQAEVYCMWVTGFTASMAASWLSMPDIRQQRWVFWMPFLSLAISVYAIGLQFADDEMSKMLFEPDINHLMGLFALLVIPSVFFFFLLNRAATTRLNWTSGMAGLAISSYAYIAIRLMSPIDTLENLMLWAVLPVTIYGVLVWVGGKKFLKW